MRLSAMLCDKATVREGLLHVLGGGLTNLGRDTIPGPLGINLAVVVSFEDEAELDVAHELSFEVTAPSGAMVISGNVGWQVEKPDMNDPILPNLPIAFELAGATVSEEGNYNTVISLDGVEAARLPFNITALERGHEMSGQYINFD